MGVSTASVVCPYCGREQTPYARFCDRCGNDLSAFWASMQPLVRQVYDRQLPVDVGKRSAPRLSNRVRAPQSNLSPLRRWRFLGKLTRNEGAPARSHLEPETKVAQLQSTSPSKTLPPAEQRIDTTTEQPALVRPTQAGRGDVVCCYKHTQRTASYKCAICARNICGECSSWAAENVYVCPECWQSER